MSPKLSPSPAIWITRARPGAEATAARLTTLGFTPIIAPLLEARPLPEVTLDLAGIGGLTFTSLHAVRYFIALTDARPGPVFTVGDATAEAATAAGFSDVRSADGDVNDLAALIAGASAGLTGPILHPGALQPAGDLIGDLAARGIAARALPIYQTLEQDPVTILPELAGLHAVLVHSPRAARGLAAFLTAHSAPDIRLLTLSEAVAAPLRGVKCVELAVAQFPNEASLLKLL